MPERVKNSTGDDQIDGALLGMLGKLALAFPGRLRACYVEGSYADGSGLGTSDIDLVVVFCGRFQQEGERDEARRLIARLWPDRAAELDVDVVDEASLQSGVWPSLKLGSLLIYGEDRRADWPLLPIEEWARQRMHAAFWLMIRVFKRPAPVTLPLDYPQPTGEFYGYDQREVGLPDGRRVASTRDLIRVTGWAATALLALKARVYVARKSDCHLDYRQHLNDGWAPLLSAIYDHCRTRWRYLIPEDESERQLLKDICARTLDFENYFMAEYRRFLLSELTGHDESGRREALRRLREIPLIDPAVEAALRQIGFQPPLT